MRYLAEFHSIFLLFILAKQKTQRGKGFKKRFDDRKYIMAKDTSSSLTGDGAKRVGSTKCRCNKRKRKLIFEFLKRQHKTDD